MSSVVHIILTHGDTQHTQKLISWWKDTLGESADLLIAHGGAKADFDALPFKEKIFIEDSRLKTQDHQREKQSYQSVFKEAAAWIRERDFDYVYFAEYDQLPLIEEFDSRLIQRLQEEEADVLGHHLKRVDGTHNPHYLYHQHTPEFSSYWQTISNRKNQNVVLSMLGTGHFWKVEAFLAVAALEPPLAVYLELFIPTAAHHLGYRVADLSEQNQYVVSHEDQKAHLQRAQSTGSWSIHPIKNS